MHLETPIVDPIKTCSALCTVGGRTMDTNLYESLRVALKEAEEGALVAGAHKALQILKENGQLFEAQLEPHLVGIHPENRDGYGCNLADAFALMQNILDIGWHDTSAIGYACAMPTEEQAKQHALDFNKSMVEKSHGQLPPIPDLRFLSLSCSHTNVGLRCLKAGVQSTSLPTMHEIETKDKPFAEAVHKGIRWRVISYEITQAFPKLPQILQSCFNSQAQISKGEHELQMLRRIMSAISSSQFFGNNKHSFLPIAWCREFHNDLCLSVDAFVAVNSKEGEEVIGLLQAPEAPVAVEAFLQRSSSFHVSICFEIRCGGPPTPNGGIGEDTQRWQRDL